MRGALFLAGLSVLAPSMAVAQPLPAKVAALTQGSMAVLWDCAAPAPAYSLDAGDQPGHAFMIGQVKCTAARGELAGVMHKEGVGTEFHEVTGNMDHFIGVFVETLANGDKVSYTYKGTVTAESGSNTFSSTSGTGKFKGIKASGTCKGVVKPGGGTSVDCSGKYQIQP
jgi:hypothetical protein